MTAAVREPSLSERIAASLREKPDGILEMIAAQCGASLRQVLEHLPDGTVRFLPGDRLEELWQELARWEKVLLIVHTPDIVLECEGPLPPGTTSHGYFNIHGDSPIGGHIKASNCAAIALVDRPFHGRRSCSVQFLNGEGDAMFKVFVPRDTARELEAPALAKFVALFRRETP